MANNEDAFKKIISHAKEYGLYFHRAKFMMDWLLFTIMVNWVLS